MNVRLRTILACAVVAAVVIGVTEWLEREPPASRPGPEAGTDPFAFDALPSNPLGAPFRAYRALAAGDAFEGDGTFSFDRATSGDSGRMVRDADLHVAGTFHSARRAEADDGTLRLSLEVDVDGAGAGQGRLDVKVDPTKPDPTSLRGAVVSVRGIPADAMEPVLAVLLARLPVPDREVRVGEAFPAREVVDVEPMRRSVFSLFRYDPRGVASVLGGSRVVSRSGTPPDEVAVVDTLLRHAQDGATSAPKAIPVRAEYETVVRARRRIRLADPSALDASWSAARRLHVVSSGVDFTTRTDLAATVVEHR